MRRLFPYLTVTLELDYIDSVTGEPHGYRNTLHVRIGDTINISDEGLFSLKVGINEEH